MWPSRKPRADIGSGSPAKASSTSAITTNSTGRSTTNRTGTTIASHRRRSGSGIEASVGRRRTHVDGLRLRGGDRRVSLIDRDDLDDAVLHVALGRPERVGTEEAVEQALAARRQFGGQVGHDPQADLLTTVPRSEEHTSELQSPYDLVCR